MHDLHSMFNDLGNSMLEIKQYSYWKCVVEVLPEIIATVFIFLIVVVMMHTFAVNKEPSTETTESFEILQFKGGVSILKDKRTGCHYFLVGRSITARADGNDKVVCDD